MTLYKTGVRQAIDDWLIEEAKKERDYGDYWSASSAGYCMRKVIFERLGVPHVETESDARKQRVFTSGHLFHDWIQGITKQAGLSIASEVELQDEDLMVRGHFDDLIKLEDKLILYDYKTVNSRSFMWSKKNGAKMSHYHRMQLGTYMYMLRKYNYFQKGDTKFTFDEHLRTTYENMGKIEEARILKIEKDTLMMEEIQLMWSSQLEQDVVGYWRTLNGYWEKQMIPRCTCADYEKNEKTGIGFMADPRYNPYFYEGEPCNIKLYERFKENNNVSKVK